MEHSTLNYIQDGGINAGHLWANMIFDNVTFNNTDKYGIELNNKGLNASFTNCDFHKVNSVGIAVNELSNLLVAHSTFHSSCDQLPIGSR